MSRKPSIAGLPAGRRAKWVVVAVWVIIAESRQPAAEPELPPVRAG